MLDLLAAFETQFNLPYHALVPLDGNVSSVFCGQAARLIVVDWRDPA
jgi:hypothetical protein